MQSHKKTPWASCLTLCLLALLWLCPSTAFCLTQTEKEEIQEKILKIWNEHLEKRETLEKTLRKGYQTPNPIRDIPTPLQTQQVLLKANKAQIPVTLVLTTASLYPSDKESLILAGLICPLEVIPKDHPHLSDDKKFLLYPNSPNSQEALALGYPTKLEYSDTFLDLQKKSQKK